MADIRINQLPLATGPTGPMPSDVVALDGTTTRRASLSAIADAIRPVATQAEAEAGTDAVKAMTPLTTKQSIASEIGDTLASAAQGLLASTAMQPSTYDPNGVNSDAFSSANQRFIQSGVSASQRTVQAKLRETVSVKDFGAVGDGVADDTLSIQRAFDSTATRVIFPDGNYRIVDSLQNGTPTLLSSVPDRVIEGPGRITATSRIYIAMRVSGDRSKIHLSFAGNNQIMNGLSVTGDGCEVSGCRFFDLFAPLNVWQAIAVWAELNGGDKNISITGNYFNNIQALGDGTLGNGLGMSKAIVVSGNQNITKASLIANNVITSIIGEEGDGIAVLCQSGSAYLDLPVLISGNTITTWTRRAIKIQANRAVIRGNLLQNTYDINPGNMEHAIALIQGGNHIVDDNVLSNCKFGGQINLNADDSSQRVDNIVITNNTIIGIGAETTIIPIFVDSFGEGVVVSGNKVLSPNLTTPNVIAVTNALSGYVGNNVLKTSSSIPYTFLGSVNLVTDMTSENTGVQGVRTTSTSGDAWELVVSGALNRSLVLRNYDQAISNDELISSILFHQNDDGSNIVTAGIEARGGNSVGATKLTFLTGDPTTPRVRRWTVSILGDFHPEADNTYNIGSSSLRVKGTYAVNRYWNATVFDSSGTGTPEGVVTAGVGSTYRRLDGGASTTFYVKQTGTGNTGWVAK